MDRDQARADAVRALRAAFPDRWEQLLEAIQRPQELHPSRDGFHPFAFRFHARIGEEFSAAVVGDTVRHGLQLIRAEHSPDLVVDECFPFPFSLERIRVVAPSSAHATVVTFSTMNMEIARWTLGELWPAAKLAYTFDVNQTYQLWIDPRGATPFDLVVTLEGLRVERFSSLTPVRPFDVTLQQRTGTDLVDELPASRFSVAEIARGLGVDVDRLGDALERASRIGRRRRATKRTTKTKRR